MTRTRESFTLDNAIGTDSAASDFQYTGQKKEKKKQQEKVIFDMHSSSCFLNLENVGNSPVV